MHKKSRYPNIFDKFLILFLFLLFSLSLFYFTEINILLPQKTLAQKDVNFKLLFTGDIFLDRGIAEKSMKSPLKFKYPFSGLSTLERDKYDGWIGNLECPVTEEQSTQYEKEVYLKFSCKKEFLPELKKYFDVVSLANNHTNNMNERKGIEETRKHLDDVGIKYFGDYDNSQKEEVCKIIFLENKQHDKIPFAFCGFHGVYKLPTEKELEIIKDYSKYFITFVMPHQGEEYKFTSNSFQKKIYRMMVDNGADAVYGAHPHVIQESEEYKGKQIFYSLGNFIFDQTWVKTREHMVIDTSIEIPQYNNNYKNLKCDNLSSIECLKMAKDIEVKKPQFTINFKKIYTKSDLDFITTMK